MNSNLQIGDLIKFEYAVNDHGLNWYMDIGIILDLFENAENQEFAEVLWESGQIGSIHINSLDIISDEENINTP